MADNETVADIIAEMRGMGNYQRYSGDHARVLANRLEAAHKRERGDAAKLREAVGYILKYADCAACRDHDGHTRHYIDQICRWAQSALAAPARNCDRFLTYEDAMAGHALICEKYKKCHNGCPLNTTEHEHFWECFERWLFAKAEGGNDGNE